MLVENMFVIRVRMPWELSDDCSPDNFTDL